MITEILWFFQSNLLKVEKNIILSRTHDKKDKKRDRVMLHLIILFLSVTGINKLAALILDSYDATCNLNGLT